MLIVFCSVFSGKTGPENYSGVHSASNLTQMISISICLNLKLESHEVVFLNYL